MEVLLFVTALGLVIGSFLNVVILRHERGRAVTGRSACMCCGHTLRWYELVPLFSYLLQRGRCRVCKARISAQYPLVEALTALVFVAVFFRIFGITTTYNLQPTTLITLVLAWALWSTLIVITVYDLRTKLIPDFFNVTFAVLALCTTLFSAFSSTTYHLQPTTFALLAEHILAGGLLFLPFYILWKISAGRWIGLGDGKLAVGMGFLLGITGSFSAVMFGFWVGAVVMLAVMVIQRAVSHILFRRTYNLPPTTYHLHSEVPFGPFLIIGTAIVYFTGTTFLTLFWQ